MKALPVGLILLLLAGCAAPKPAAEEPEAPDPVASAPPPLYEAIVRVSAEAPDGPAIEGAEVYAVDERDMPVAASQLPLGLYTDAQGAVRLVYPEPVTVVLQVLGPGEEWTREGLRVTIGHHVSADDGFVVSEREVFVPLYRSQLRLSTNATWDTALAGVGPDGMVDPEALAADLALPDGPLGLAYLQRLSSADVRLSWNETATSRAELAAGLAWDGEPWVVGEPEGPGVLPGEREARFAGDLPAEGQPADLAAARLQAVAVTRSAVVGEVPLGFDVTLGFSGRVPEGMPEPLCLSMACPALPPVLPPA